MLQYFLKSTLLLFFSLFFICIIYPVALWLVGQIFFPFQANGSLLLDTNGKPLGSKLIAQPFTKDEYFHSRPSAAAYDAAASASSALAASNYALRDRVARMLGPIVKYHNGPKRGQLVGLDIVQWFQQDKFRSQPHIVAQWATLHPALAQTWVNSDPAYVAYVNNWAKTHPALIAYFIKKNPNIKQPNASDLAVLFFQNFSKENPGKFPAIVTAAGNQNGPAIVEPAKMSSDIESIFFDMWCQDHPNVALQEIPGDFVTTSASGLDPHITLQNAEYQLERIVAKWASNLHRDPNILHKEIEQLLQENASAPFGGFAGEKIVNVLELNLALRKRYG